MLATDLADYLVTRGIPFREAHNILGKIVKYATDNQKLLNQIPLEEYKNFSIQFDKDVYDYLSADKCLYNKKTFGSPNPKMVKEQINSWKEKLG
jgi:argininosuccinate lyase